MARNGFAFRPHTSTRGDAVIYRVIMLGDLFFAEGSARYGPWRYRWEAEDEAKRLIAGGGTDYRDLLMKYIAHVAEQEGATFLNDPRRPSGLFSDDEWSELHRLDDASKRYDPPRD
jgi:hypothetical protein